ncbi:uncharacterized protein [Spinacia oleracea]|uniref:Endonuclease/exonuclease/phosphatase domain-containing protein n=1 Tax=Spinacia oleracea TaxID=3562 RepID=A0ABM3RJE3_SPIOL|nr:uncharacterized protein LOC110779008 [Spinacia oleracea]
MIICSWNVRGLNAPSKVVEVRRFLQKNEIDVVALVETRVVNKTDQFIHGVICTKTGLTTFEFTAVYGLHTIDHRKPLWVDLVNIASTVSKPWLLMGDFNSVLYSGDRINGSQVQDSETRDFEGCIDAAGLAELKSCGHFFSWSNKGQGDRGISSRIDRALGCAAWHTVFDGAIVDYLNPGISDHSPLVLTCNAEDHSKGRPFRFFNYMAGHPSFTQVVQDGWKVNIHGTAMYQVWQKLKCVKQGLKTLHKKEFARLEERIDNIRTDLDGIQHLLAATPTDSELQVNEKKQLELLKKFLGIQESAYRQKSRIQWLKTGDSNSKFFFSAMKERYTRNSIDLLYDTAGRKLVTTEEIQKEICDFYKELVGSAADNLVGIDLDVVRKGNQLTANAAQGLVVPVTNEEIDVALAGINIHKAPGLDGFNSFFFKKAWGIVKDDVYAAVKEFLKLAKC